MAVYLNASGYLCAKKCEKRTALQLGQSVELPYFNAFSKPLLTLHELYLLLEQQIEQVLEKAGWAVAEMSQIPVFLGSTGYVVADCEARLAANQSLPTEYSIAVIGDYLKHRYQTQVFSLATSCTSSAQGVNYAFKMLQTGRAKKALVIGFELFNRLTFEHFQSMGLLAQTAKGEGIILGEGLACLALSLESNSPFSCEFVAVSSLTDNDNLTNNSEQALRCLITKILEKARLQASDIQGVKIHAVGGTFDLAEQRILQEILPNCHQFSVKQHIGHTLGASGAVETAWLVEQLQKSSQNAPLLAGYYLCYFLGFGGSNVAWVMKVE
ncbi:beta-ketoacyl synthase N-terminal-like domain-containing protein [Conservatibacter flavescens]|uniref:Beta-ketoacyl synthase n=1 Tax=Conservatibacter flavescens TaxID=28161 RepID=A0A2M8S2Q0_9PAST|nr:beta-ketoacyl synthase N-terminal-like domain-containing protein [Conservatibacter flavescens]PJG85415.1 beta-ketoacyl synthase [Conservatibacter flavescens]